MRFLAITLLCISIAHMGRGQTEWPMYGHDLGGVGYSPLKQIDTENVGKLQIAWTYDTRPAAVPASEGVEAKPAPRNRASQAAQSMAGGILHLSPPSGHVLAMVAVTGQMSWEYATELLPCC